MTPRARPRRTLWITLLVLGCAGDPARDPAELSDQDAQDQAALGEPCNDSADCPTGAYCVADPCASGPDDIEQDDTTCGLFTCRIECASASFLLCSDGFSCCGSNAVCDGDSVCRET